MVHGVVLVQSGDSRQLQRCGDRRVNKLLWIACNLLVACGRLDFDVRDQSAITEVALIRAGDGHRVTELCSEARLDVATLYAPAPGGIAVAAEVTGAPAYVRFQVNDGYYDAYDAPWQSAERTDYDAHLVVGYNRITVTAFDEYDVPSAPAIRELYLDAPIDTRVMWVTKVELIDNYNGNVLVEVRDVPIAMADLASSMGEIDIRITPQPTIVGSVATTVSGPVQHTFVDGWPVYTAFGPRGGFAPRPGAYTVTATPYELGATAGHSGAPRTVTFEIVP